MKPNIFMDERKYFIDWLRVISIILLVPFHAALLFNDWAYHIKNDSKSFGFVILAFLIAAWHMPMLFFISGVGQSYSLSYRAKGEFIKERLKRLLIPLVWGILIVVPPQTYYERLQKMQFSGSFFEFYPYVFNGLYPAGNFTWNHLWFLAYLLVFSLISLPFFSYLKKPKEARLRKKFISFFEKGAWAFALGIPFFITEFFLRINWPGTLNLIADWANFWYFLIIFCYGYILCSGSNIWDAFERNKKVALSIGLILSLASLNIYYFALITPENRIIYTIWMGLKGFNMWCWIIALTGFAKTYLNYSNPFLKYANEAALPFYILHQTLLIAIGFYVAQWNTSMISKFVIICMATFITTLGAYEGIRRLKILRLLFGMNTTEKNRVQENPQGNSSLPPDLKPVNNRIPQSIHLKYNNEL